MKLSEKLEQVREVLDEHGVCKRVYKNNEGQYCIEGAIFKVAGVDVETMDGSATIGSIGKFLTLNINSVARDLFNILIETAQKYLNDKYEYDEPLLLRSKALWVINDRYENDLFNVIDLAIVKAQAQEAIEEAQENVHDSSCVTEDVESKELVLA